MIEVECLDRPGLLYDITQAIFEAGLSISTSMVATYGERAVDVFYVRDGFGHKIVHPARLDAVEKRLKAALAPAPLEAPASAKAVPPNRAAGLRSRSAAGRCRSSGGSS